MENDIETLQKILQEDPSNFQARRELSILLVNNGFNEEAETNLEYLTKYFPEDADLFYNLGIVYEKLKKFEQARDVYKKAVELSPQEDFYYNLGEVHVDLKEWDEAEKCFKKVLETDPNDGNSFFNLGLCYYNREEKNKALDAFQKAVSINPKDVYAYFYLGYIYQDDGLTNFAIDSYKKVLEVSPDYSWAYYNLGSIAFKSGNDEEAKEYLRKTIQYNPADYEAYKLLVKICLKNSETEEVLELLHTRLDEEENGDLYYCLARVYKFIGDLDEYYDNLQNALDNPYTLSYSKKAVKQELDYVGGQIGRHEELEPERTVEEYNSENENGDELPSEEKTYKEFDDDEEPDEADSEYEELDSEYEDYDEDGSVNYEQQQYEEIPEYTDEEE